MYEIIRFFIDETKVIFGIPDIVRRVVENNPEIRVEFQEPNKVVALGEVLAWNHWRNKDPFNNTNDIDCHNMDGKFPNSSYSTSDKNGFSNFVTLDTIEGWQCDISDVEGLDASKSDLKKFLTLDDFAVNGTFGLVDDISEANLNKILTHNQIRIINSKNSNDHFVRHHWDGRVFLVNSGGSHNFAAARYIAKKLSKCVPLKGTLYDYKLNPSAINNFLHYYDIYIMWDKDIYGKFFDSMLRYGASFCIYRLPRNRQFEEKKILLLPHSQKRSKQVSKLLREHGFYDFGKYLKKISSHDNIGR